MSDTPNPIALMFSAPGGQILAAMAEAIAKARDSNCDCETCVMLRAGDAAFGHLMTNGPEA